MPPEEEPDQRDHGGANVCPPAVAWKPTGLMTVALAAEDSSWVEGNVIRAAATEAAARVI